MNIESKPERAGSVLGVAGRFFAAHAWDAERFSNQTWISHARQIAGYGSGAEMRVELQFDDQCKNGHNTFSITAEVTTPASKRRRDIEAGGCMHEEIARVFPELAPLIQWHLTSTDGPVHYIANTVYHAGDRDHNGLLAGEKRQIRNGRSGLPAWKLVYIDAAGNEIEKPEQYIDSETQPTTDARIAYVPWCREGEGKARQLDAARSIAVWPEATDAELCADKATLTAALNARLPALLERFKAAMVGAGFYWSPTP